MARRAEVGELPGCLASGATLDELITAVWDAIRLCITPAEATTLASIRVLVESLGLRVESDREVQSVPSSPEASYGTLPRSRDPHRRREAAVGWQRRGNRVGHGSRLTEWTDADLTDVQKQAAAAYGRMMDAEQELYALWERAGLNLEDWDAVTDAGPAADDEKLWVCDLGRKAAALGGRLELVAVFPGRTVTLLREPEPADDAAATD